MTEDIRSLTTEQLQDVLNKAPSPSISEAYGNALWSRDNETQRYLRQAVIARSALIYHLRFRCDISSEDIGVALGWVQLKADEILSTGESTVEGMIDD
jgi:hypothetical protein